MSVRKISVASAAAIALTGAAMSPSQGAPLPTSIATIKSMLPSELTEVRWVGWRGGWGYRGWGYRPWGWGAAAAGAVIGGAIVSGAYYGSYPDYGYGGGYGYTGGYAYDCNPYDCGYGYGPHVYGGYYVRPYRQYYYGW